MGAGVGDKTPRDIAGEAVLRDLAEHGYEVVKKAAPEPVRLVTMEESRGACSRRSGMLRDGMPWFDQPQWFGDKVNAADDWLVRTVNRRIINRLPRAFWGGPDLVRTGDDEGGYTAYRADLLRIFCGEGGK